MKPISEQSPIGGMNGFNRPDLLFCTVNYNSDPNYPYKIKDIVFFGYENQCKNNLSDFIGPLQIIPINQISDIKIQIIKRLK